MSSKKGYSPGFKKRVVIEAIKGEKTIAEISSEYKVPSKRIYMWKQSFLDNCATVFEDSKGNAQNAQIMEKEKQIEQLQKKVGQLVIENDFLKKKLL